MDTSKGLQAFWPSIVDEVSAKNATKLGFYSAVFISVITAIPLLYRIIITQSFDLLEIYSSILGNILPMAIIAFFIHRMLRVASVCALALCVTEMFYKYNAHNSLGMYPLFILFFINSIRGTFAYYKLLSVKKEQVI
ncbi:MAG: hypothetical protein MUO63_02510 [Desulfobulbaceae bacterium]|nr:hypothetical protein [Desulfobulbaceae bacterium]